MLRKFDRISEKCSRPATPATVYVTKARKTQTKRGTIANGRPRACTEMPAEYVFGMLFPLVYNHQILCGVAGWKHLHDGERQYD